MELLSKGCVAANSLSSLKGTLDKFVEEKFIEGY